jgi:PAS domain S-box-containing protein
MSGPTSSNAQSAPLNSGSTADFLQGGGEMGALMRAHPWHATCLGNPEGWPPPLRTALGVILNTGHPMYIWWGSELLCFYNDAYRQSIGPERHPDSLGRPGRVVWEEIWDIIGPQIEQVMSGGGPTWRENALIPITRNGRREDVYWTYSYSPIVDPTADRGVGGVLVVCAETTDQVATARRAIEERERFKQLFEQAPIFMAMLRGPDHRFEFVNPNYRRLIGARDLIGRSVVEAVPESISQGYVDLLDRVYRSGEPFTATGMKLAIEHDPGARAVERYLDFVYQPVKDETDAVSGIFVVGVDATERNDADNALRKSEEQLRLATEAAEVGLWDVDVGSDILYWPPRVKAMFGISADRPVSMSEDFFPCLHPEDRERVTTAFTAALDPTLKALYEVEYRTVGKEDGVIRWIAAKGRGVFDGDRCVRVLGTAIDITERKATEAELKDLNERLEHRVAAALAEKSEAEAHIRQAQKIEALGQLTGGVAHDFNNLLMIIKGGVSLLKRTLIEPERRQRLLAGMEQAADRGATLSRQLLAFARRQPLKPESVNLVQQIEGMRELLDRTLRGDVHVRTEWDEDLWPVEVDPAELELVILNLCVNARDAMPKSGVITIRGANASAFRRGDLHEDFVALSVVDTGSGMSPEVLAHAFEPFYTTKEIGKGTGLGLPQVHGFARQSGGDIKIDSVVDRGTTVTLWLPRTQVVPSVAAAALELDQAVRRRGVLGSILLVEDDDEVAALVTEMLRELGYCVTRAASAIGALGALANDRDIDLVFSDVLMPGEMNGVELAREIKRRRLGMPILLTTGYASGALSNSDDKDIEVLYKPYEIQALDAALRAVRQRRGGNA